MKKSSPIVIMYWGLTAYITLVVFVVISPLLWVFGIVNWTYSESEDTRDFVFKFEQSFYKPRRFIRKKY